MRNPIYWWNSYGESCPQLQEVAKKILTIPPTAAGSERNWSVWKNIWSNKRSCMHLPRVGMLVYVYYNVRMLKERGKNGGASANDYEETLEYLESLVPVSEDALATDLANNVVIGGEE